jgi:nucleotide exchange factor SIL1
LKIILNSFSNPKVQVFAIKTELLQILLKQISNVAESASLSNQDYLSKLVFVLSGFLRNFPYAQNEFLKLGGSEILSYLIKSNSNSVKVKTKILTLADDLIKEKVKFAYFFKTVLR